MARKRSTSPAEEPAAEALPAQPTAIELPPAAATRHAPVDPTVPAALARLSHGRGERPHRLLVQPPVSGNNAPVAL